MLPTAG